MCARTESVLLNYYNALFRRFGPQKWWPAETPLEVVAGAILTQNTNWKNVERALSELKKEGLLTPEILASTDAAILSRHIRPAGYFRAKARCLLSFVDYFKKGYNLDFDRFGDVETPELRAELLQIWGIGPETADSILLYALGRPVFVVDAYTRRVITRHRITDEAASYGDIQHLFMSRLPVDTSLFNEYHALLVRLGKEHCRKKPDCDECPLFSFMGEEFEPDALS